MHSFKRLVFGGALLVVFGVGAYYVIKTASFALSPLSSPARSQEAVLIEVHKGKNPSEIIRDLVSNQIMSASVAKDFMWLGRVTRQWKKIKAGEYKVSPAMSPIQIFSVLTSGISVIHPITIREGENMYEIGGDLETKKLTTKKHFVGLCRSPQLIRALGFQENIASLEGYLFPDTYFFNRTMNAEDMIRQMVKHFATAWGAKEDERARQLGMTRHQAVTLASIVEKETGAPHERPMISSVFHNRLKKKMRLQSDPTTIYGIWENYSGNIHKSDLLRPTPYNTYTLPALPVGPISNPGKESIQAALFPAQSDYYFFVSHNDGTHEFTTSFKDHNKAVKTFQLDKKARVGKSWRDLKK